MLVKGATAVGTAALRQWRSLPEEQRREVQSEAAAVMTATVDLSRAVVGNAGRFRASRRSKKWERRREEVLNSTPEFTLAKRIVDLVQKQGPLREEQLAALVGADGKDDPTLVRALRYAREAGLVIDEGGQLESATEDSILRNNKSLRYTGHIEELEGRIRAHMLAEGFASLDDIASSLRVGKEDLSLLAALHRTLSSGDVEWINTGIYGLPVEQLRQLKRTDDAEAADPLTARSAAARLYEAAQALGKATAQVRKSSDHDRSPSPLQDASVMAGSDPQDALATMNADGDRQVQPRV
jgi:hypothetical protein